MSEKQVQPARGQSSKELRDVRRTLDALRSLTQQYDLDTSDSTTDGTISRSLLASGSATAANNNQVLRALLQDLNKIGLIPKKLG